MTPEVRRPFLLDRVGPGGAEAVVEATAAELPVVAERLGVPAVQALRSVFALRRIGGGVVAADGHLQARVTRTCVVTLDEFEQDVAERFTIHFVPAGHEDEDPEPDDPDEIPVEGGVADLGEAAVEQLALVLDPYPRKPGAELPAEAGEASENPFAALAGLRPRQ